jgi:superfamily II DNA or RNA helicase
LKIQMSTNVIGTDVNQVEISSLSKVIGQSQVCSLLKVNLEAYFKSRSNQAENQATFGPVCLCGPSGTGKTMIAAFDYLEACRDPNDRPTLLFLAHRKEILEQAQDSFRQVLGDGNFGEALYDSRQPASHDYLFCSVPSFNSRNLIGKFGPDYWDIVILDEAHHGKAFSYKAILNELKPKILLGLTATPERTDGTSIEDDFDSPLAAEIRLPDALEKKLLCPFHYYAISDIVDFSSLSWTRGKYDNKQLNTLLTGRDDRVNLIIKKLIKNLPTQRNQKSFVKDGIMDHG